MFTIGDFARYGRVSARMLRHYDAIGLLPPDRTDPATGYRFYGAAQLARLNRIIALKDLGFTLQQVRAILDEQVGPEELRGMLRLRRAELEEAMRAAGARLAQVEARLRSIESEGRMSMDDVVVRNVAAVRVAELAGTAAGYEPEDITPVIGPLYDRLFPLLGEAGVSPSGPGIAYYEDAPEGGGAVVVHAGSRSPPRWARWATPGSRWSSCPRSRRPPSCTGGRWTAYCRRPRPWPAGSMPTATGPRGTPGRSAWSAPRIWTSG